MWPVRWARPEACLGQRGGIVPRGHVGRGLRSRPRALALKLEATDLVPVNLVGAVQQPHRSRVREHLAQQEVVRETRTAEGLDSPEIGRASCRERVCQYV